MNWFAGNIPEAIAAAKARNAIFVVYVYDSSEASQTTDDTLSQDEVVSMLGSEHFVAIRLENGTVDAKFFSQIYPLVLMPSLFFISGETGLPLEVLGGPLAPSTLRQKLNKLVSDKDGASNSATSTAPSPAAPAEPVPSTTRAEAPTQPQVSDPSVRSKVSTSIEENNGDSAAKSSVTNDDESKEQVSDQVADDSENASLDEKVERAKVLLAEKQAKDAREKAEDQRQKEVERRKMGQEIAKQRQQQEEDSLRQAAMERKKDKEEDRLARERVRAQIAIDRAEREARAAMLRGEQRHSESVAAAAAARPAPQPAPVPSTSNTSRLKFRLPDGSSSLGQFPASTTLGEVRQYIQDNINLPFSNFTLASTVHQGAFRAQDDAMSLRDLGLVPSAILAIVPASGGSSVGRALTSGGGGFWDLIWLLLTPITFLLGILRGFMGGGGGGNRPASNTSNGPAEKKAKREEGSATTRNRPQTAYGNRGEARLRREGNVIRLNNPDDDDEDENNTWNGNSTQQM